MTTMPRRITDTCDEVIPAAGYRSATWHEARLGCVSASEIPVVLGISRFQSRFDLWWAKRLGESGVADNQAMSRGRRVEPLVLEDFEIEHPEFRLRHVGLARNTERPWQVATPDAIAYESGGTLAFTPDGTARDFTTREPVAVVEAKTDGGSDHWGDEGSDDIPVDYKAQVLWQMDTLGVTTGYVPVWIGYIYRCYVVHADADDVAFMREQAQAFLASLDADEPPPVDSHATTTERLKRLHPDVVDEAVEIPETLARQYLAASQLADTAKQRKALAENRIRALMGPAQRAVLEDGRKIASRSVFDVKARTQIISAHTQDRLTVRAPKGTRKQGKAIDVRPVQCHGTNARGKRCGRKRVTSAETWVCRDHGGRS